MIDWDECIPQETYFIDANGIRSLFLAKHHDCIFYLGDESGIYYAHNMSVFKNAKIVCTAIDLELLRPGCSILRDGERDYRYLLKAGDALLITYDYDPNEKFVVYCVLPKIYQKWTVVKYE